MEFGYMFSGPQYCSQRIEAASLELAVDSLEHIVPETYFDNAHAPEQDFFVEFWFDGGRDRKDINSEESHEVYKLIPSQNGYLLCDALAEHYWAKISVGDYEDFPFLSISSAMEWIGNHHSKGLPYLRYGAAGQQLDTERLAELGAQVINHLDALSSLLSKSNENVDIALYNVLRLSHQECVKLGLVSANDPFYRLYDSDTSTNVWYTDISKALVDMKNSCAFSQVLLYNGNDTVLSIHDGKIVSRVPSQLIALSEDERLSFLLDAGKINGFKYGNFSRDAWGQIEPKPVFFYVTKPGEPTPCSLPTICNSALRNGVYDAAAALSAFESLGDTPGKALGVAVQAPNGEFFAYPILEQIEKTVTCTPSPFLRSLPFVKDVAEKASTEVEQQCFQGNVLSVGNWSVRIIAPGDTYGNGSVNDCGKSLVAFYDARQKDGEFGPDGQFTGGCYLLETLLGKDRWNKGEDLTTRGLSLDDSIRSWTVSSEEMTTVVNWLRGKEKELSYESKPSLDVQLKNASTRTQQSKCTEFHTEREH